MPSSDDARYETIDNELTRIRAKRAALTSTIIDSGTMHIPDEPLEEEIYVETTDEANDTHTGDQSQMDDELRQVSHERIIAKREDAYHARRRLRTLSPSRTDPFNKARENVDEQRSYADVLAEGRLAREQASLVRELRNSYRQRQHEMQEHDFSLIEKQDTPSARRHWEMSQSSTATTTEILGEETPIDRSEWEEDESRTLNRERRKSFQSENETPLTAGGTPLSLASTPLSTTSSMHSRLTRWDATPAHSEGMGATPVRGPDWGAGSTPLATSLAPGEETPLRPDLEGETPLRTPRHMISPSFLAHAQLGMTARNAFISDDELDILLPSAGYLIVDAPASYEPIRRSKTEVHPRQQGPAAELGLFALGGEGLSLLGDGLTADAAGPGSGLPPLKPDDYQHFGALLGTMDRMSEDVSSLTLVEIRELKLLRLLLKLKNGTPPMRKVAQRQIVERAREFGPAMLFDKILPLLMSPSLEDVERHLLVKLIDRILFRLEDGVRPFVHKILVVVEPLLIDTERATRAEGRELVSNLAKAAGLATMIGAMRPDIDHPDDYVRNCTARALAVVALALGIPALLPFLAAVTASQRGGWEASHTGIRTIQHIATMAGCGVLPHLRELVGCAAAGLSSTSTTDKVLNGGSAGPPAKVRTAAALALAALAEASAPHGIEAFEGVLRPLWQTIRQARGRALAAMLKAIGAIIPLMTEEYSSYYARELVPVVVREMSTPDDDLRRTVISVVRQMAEIPGALGSTLLSTKILSPFFKYLWTRRLSADKRTAFLVVEGALAIVKRIGAGPVTELLLPALKDESGSFRRMALELLERLVRAHGSVGCLQAAGAEAETIRSIALLVDSLLFALQHEDEEEEERDGLSRVARVMGIALCACGTWVRPHLGGEISSMLLWRLNNKSARIRQQAADVIAELAPLWITCSEDVALQRLAGVLFEYLGEEFPAVLGSIIRALHAIVRALGTSRMHPPIKDLLPRLTPILKNRHEKVQLHCIELVGRIAGSAAEAVSPREWMRICWELLETLHAHRRAIRRAAILSFGHIAKAIGPQDVLSTLLANLRVQERQSRVCTTIAIAIVAEVG